MMRIYSRNYRPGFAVSLYDRLLKTRFMKDDAFAASVIVSVFLVAVAIAIILT